MKRMRLAVVALLAGVMVALFGAETAFAAGSWNASDTSTTYVYAKNIWYNGQTIKAGLPVSGVINNVSWSYSVSYPVPSGRAVQLCDDTWGQCLDVSGLGTGSSAVFNSRPASDQFFFRAEVVGTGSLSPAWQVYNKSLTVSYQ